MTANPSFRPLGTPNLTPPLAARDALIACVNELQRIRCLLTPLVGISEELAVADAVPDPLIILNALEVVTLNPDPVLDIFDWLRRERDGVYPTYEHPFAVDPERDSEIRMARADALDDVLEYVAQFPAVKSRAATTTPR